MLDTTPGDALRAVLSTTPGDALRAVLSTVPADARRGAAASPVPRGAVPPRAVLAALAACLLLAACGDRGAGVQAPTRGPGAGGPPPAMPVTAIEARPEKVPVLIEAVGQTEGSKEVEVRARVAGVLERQFHRDGEVVKAGAPLFQIDRAPFEIARDQARAALAQETSNLEQARREAARLAPLAEQRAISQREADDARSAQRRIEAAVLAAQTRVREADLNLSYTRVNAPISGVTGRAERSQGSLVNPTTDSLLTKMSVTDPIWVRFSFSESEWQRLRGRPDDATVTLLLPDGRVHPVEGRLNFSGSTVDARLGTVQMRASFANPGLALLPGQFVRARVRVGEVEAFVVPQAAVQTSDQGRFVWVVGPQGTAQPRPVRAGGWRGTGWAIEDGLVAGDRVIVDNLMKLRPGAPVAASAPGTAPGTAPAGAPTAPTAPTAPGAPAGAPSKGGAPDGKGEGKTSSADLSGSVA
jgi:membrane fusion protein (multidrug efflux system)